MVHDGLQLSQCGVPPSPLPQQSTPAADVNTAAQKRAAAAAREVWVSLAGSDAAAGTLATPFATPQRGINECRKKSSADGVTAAAAASSSCTVTLREGTYYLADSPIELTAADSGLTLRSFAGARA